MKVMTVDPRIQELDRLVLDSLFEMFNADDKCCVIEGKDDELPAYPGEAVVAGIGFAGNSTMSGSLVLVAALGAVQSLQPGGLDSVEVSPCDVLGELANMAIGRLKNRLLPRGIKLLLGTPTTAIGRCVAVKSAPMSTAWSELRVGDGEGGLLRVRLDVTFEEGFEMPEAVVEATLCLSEGDMMFF